MELLLVLFIVSILAVAGVTMLAPRQTGAVRGVMDELEGTLVAAQQRATATGRDILIATTGEWSSTSPFSLAYGEATVAGAPVSATTVLTNGANASETFRVAVNPSGGLRGEHYHAGLVTVTNKTWWGSAATGSTDITTVDPFKATAPFKGLLTDANNLCQGGTTPASARISGADKRFQTNFWIGVVSLRNGQPMAGGPLGLLVVTANSGQVYKFYNPGVLNGGNGTWRRI
jgi:type II secretory pathway pseudopilin PulG